MNNKRTYNPRLRRGGRNSRTLKPAYYVWAVFPHFLRRPLTSVGIASILIAKKLLGVNRHHNQTPLNKLSILSFWGIPDIDPDQYRLKIIGLVERPESLSLNDLRALPSRDISTHMDCVGGRRNNWILGGVSLDLLLNRAGMSDKAESAVFRCADGYITSHKISDLMSSGAFIATSINGEDIAEFGMPVRLAVPDHYGYKWAKWLTEIELVSGFPPGYWESRGLPMRGRVGDIW